MATTPKQVEESTNLIMAAWDEKAKTKSFGGMTLDQYKAKVKPSADAREAIKKLEIQMTAAIDERDDADKATLEANNLVVKGVVGDPAFGEDSALYEAMGYVRKSERKTGLTRKKKAPAAK